MMKVKIFKIRLPKEFLHKDQKMLDDFLKVHEIIKVETAFVNDENCWSVILYFDEMKIIEDTAIVADTLKTPKTVTAANTVKDPKIVKYSVENDQLSNDEEKILEALKLWRAEKAKQQNLPAYFIASNKELSSVAKYKPGRKEELLDIKGFGKHKIENYGEEILEILENT
ncbi:superfamily II DNA helicase RecQ [Chryseobacterium sp. H1D6B]|uniref:HRDC domain-containing protein n=1 Tax=Chryseobacterium sp. H1D6B TaxID=2940588 RepID=UPI0017AB44B5|nr:HRDC domain-containing protein [Chryseobacterium sp. H1D6B]MDH6254024.1 superfamily II DNA helicase RecQ [Chryseobacterium sp. H1D6B]